MCREVVSWLVYGKKESEGIFWHARAEFCWHESFAGTTIASKTAPAKFKMREQNFRCASKIINPNDFDMPSKKRVKIML